MSKEDIEKMTVAQIREQLKNKKLPISGTKNELVIRLYDGILAEEKLLEAPPSDFDISSVNVDEVLGLDPSDILSSPNEKSDVCFGIIDNSVLEKGDINCEVRQSVLHNQKRQLDNVEQPTSQPNDPAKNKDKTDEMAQEKVIQLKMAARLGLPIADVEMKTKRKNRFGALEAADDDTLKRRADRFCLDASAKSSEDEEANKVRRALRFGLASDDDDDMKTKRAKRFGIGSFLVQDPALKTQGIDDEKLLARTKRFGT